MPQRCLIYLLDFIKKNALILLWVFEQGVITNAKLWMGGLCNTDGWKVNNIEIYLNAKWPGGYTTAIEWY